MPLAWVPVTDAPQPARTGRIHELDAVRGFALCGIMLVNTWQHTVGRLGDAPRGTVDHVVENVLQGRFYPIFSVLFGVSLVLFLRSAGSRWILARRLIVLAAFGFAHTAINPGEVLLPYAVYGMAVLIPASFMPRLAVLLLGVVTTVWAANVGGGSLLIPGLFLLGMALIEYHPPRRAVPPVFLASAVLGAALTVLWAFRPVQPITAVYALAGVCSALAYATGLLLLLRTPLRAPLLSTLVPLGRTALTCYLSQTLVILAALPLLTADPTRLSVFALAAATVAAQAVLARWWLARFRYGPLEWVWRSLTWGRPVSNRIPPAPQGGSGRPG
ncbi:Uncharacterized membrane protein YeiB [Thermostaphylospora chromogena]|uniref:Uncharacterized membrane protein YeiB n=1 Tax=Thermostaphylospora chromogena TaxID=35622 RepID=A0A1H1HV84_9ACTN|nr:Uncharacterized membrane protein YeiB [Thermostaphylospora chromogena]